MQIALFVPSLFLVFVVTTGTSAAQLGPPATWVAADPQLSARFGRSVALEGSHAAIGAAGADTQGNGSRRGAVYLWQRLGGVWQAGPKVLGPPPPSRDFGRAVALEGDLLVASGLNDVSPFERAWAYRKVGGAWVQEALLVPSDPVTNAALVPRAVGVSGEWIAVGHEFAPSTPVTTGRGGAVYLYRRTGTAWIQHTKLVPPSTVSNDRVGYSLDLANGVLVYSRGTNSGASDVWVHRLSTSGVALEATLVPTSPSPSGSFGLALATDGARIAVADVLDQGMAGSFGAVYVYVHTGGQWIQEQVLRPLTPTTQFGTQVAIDGDDLFVTGVNPVRLWHFVRVGGTWTERSFEPLLGNSNFITSLSLDAGTLLIGADAVNTNCLNNSGAALACDVPQAAYGAPILGVAHAGVATQSSQASSFNTAARAIDGALAVNSTSASQTQDALNSWWQVTLPARCDLLEVRLHARVDCFAETLGNFRVSVFDGMVEVFGVDAYVGAGAVPIGGVHIVTLPPGVRGDRVRVALLGTNNLGTGVLSLREVEVLAPELGQRICSPARPTVSGLPAELRIFGSPVAGGNELALAVTGLPSAVSGYFLCSTSTGSVQPPGSRGVLCLSGAIGRLASPVLLVGPDGRAFGRFVDTLALPGFPPRVAQPGETWTFQAWFRDGASSNFSDAVSVTFL
jgi:hypothetical protein